LQCCLKKHLEMIEADDTNSNSLLAVGVVRLDQGQLAQALLENLTNLTCPLR